MREQAEDSVAIEEVAPALAYLLDVLVLEDGRHQQYEGTAEGFRNQIKSFVH